MKGTILIVDDVEDTRELLKTVLDLEGYKTIPVSNGKAALNLLEKFKPDLIIADVLMPDVSGVDLIKSLRNQPHYTDMPIIAISGFPTYIEEARRVGATGILKKPIDIFSLSQLINQHLTSNNNMEH